MHCTEEIYPTVDYYVTNIHTRNTVLLTYVPFLYGKPVRRDYHFT